MAEYSKESNFDWHDFSIKEEFDKLSAGNYIGQICEGMGFLAIAKTDEGVCELAFPDPDDFNSITWKEFDFETNTVVGGVPSYNVNFKQF